MRASISRIKLFKACRRAYQLKYIYNLEPVEVADALQIGSRYHELIETLYKDGDLLSCEEDYSKELAMATAYWKHIYPQFKVKAVEEWLEKPIGRHILIGRVDGISEDGLLVEHKTTGADITEEYEFNLQWDEQILAYMYLTGAREVYYTVIKKPTIRQKKTESDEEFFQRMVDWYDEDTDTKIRLLRISRTDQEIKGFTRGFQMMCDEMERGVIYPNSLCCNCWGRRCEYSSICLNYDPNQNYVGFIKGGRS